MGGKKNVKNFIIIFFFWWGGKNKGNCMDNLRFVYGETNILILFV